MDADTLMWSELFVCATCRKDFFWSDLFCTTCFRFYCGDCVAKFEDATYESYFLPTCCHQSISLELAGAYANSHELQLSEWKGISDHFDESSEMCMVDRPPNQSSNPAGLGHYFQPNLGIFMTTAEEEKDENNFCDGCGLKWDACTCSSFFAPTIRHYLNQYPQESLLAGQANQSSVIEPCRYFHPELEKWVEGEEEKEEKDGNKFCDACGLKSNSCICSFYSYTPTNRHYLNEYPQESIVVGLP